MKEELEQMENFDRLNEEKITPHFLNMAKKSTEAENLDCIMDENGHNFDTSAASAEYITSFFQDLYKKPANEKNISEEDIAKFFLGGGG